MNTTGIIIGVIVVVLVLLAILIVVGLQRRKSKTVSFEKPQEETPKELTQEEKSGNYQAQGGFNFAPAKPAEKEAELRPGQELTGASPAAAAHAEPAAEFQTPKPEQESRETPAQTDQPVDTDVPEQQQASAADAAAAVKGDDVADTQAPPSTTPADSTGVISTGADEPADSELTQQAMAGDLNAAQAQADEDDYQVVDESAPEQAAPVAEPAAEQAAPTAAADTNYHVVEETDAAVPADPQPVADTTDQKGESGPGLGGAAAAAAAAGVAGAAAVPGGRDDAQPEESDRAEPDVAPVEDAAAEETVAEETVEPTPVAEETATETGDGHTGEVTEAAEEAEEAAEAAQATAAGAEAALEETPVPDTPAEPTPEPVDEIAPAAGRLGRLRGRLSRSQSVIGQGVLGVLTAGDLDEDAWEEIEDTLIMADLGTTVTMKVVDSLRSKIAERGVSNEAEARAMLRETLIEAARPELDRSIKAMPYEGKPAVVLVVGVNGTGKTTTTGKLARVLVSMGHKVLLGAADTFRAAAADQLETWGNRVGATTIRGAEGADPASVAFDAVAAGVTEQADVVLIDTAGRLHTSTPLMDQLGKVKRVVEKKTEVDEVLLVLDATVGQNGLIQARTFREVVDITGVVLTKLDGTAKGGIVFQVQEELGVPVKLVGLGEGADHLAPFEVEGFVDALLGQ